MLPAAHRTCCIRHVHVPMLAEPAHADLPFVAFGILCAARALAAPLTPGSSRLCHPGEIANNPGVGCLGMAHVPGCGTRQPAARYLGGKQQLATAEQPC